MYDLDLEVSKDVIKCKIDENRRLTIFSDDVEKLTDQTYTKYKPLLDLLPEKMQNDDLEIYNSKGLMFAVEKIEDFYIMGLYGSCLWLAIHAMHKEDLLCMNLFQVLQRKVIEDFLSKGELFPINIQIFGNFNWSESYMLAVKRSLAQAKGEKINLLPRNAYPKKNEGIPSDYYAFDSLASELLAKDQSKI